MVLALLDIAQAYNNMVRDTLQEIAYEMDLEQGCLVAQLLHLYGLMVTHVWTTYRKWRGLCRGGGLDPIFYMTCVLPIHLRVILERVGVQVQGEGARYMVGSVGLVVYITVLGSMEGEPQHILYVVVGCLDVLQHTAN